jgi:hypothetical protein
MKTVTMFLLIATLAFADDPPKPSQNTRINPAANSKNGGRYPELHQKTGVYTPIGAVNKSGTKPTAEARPSRPANSQSAATSIPPGAVQLEPFLYRYTDAQGKTWMYRRTPFGVSKWEDKPDAGPVVKTPDPVTATDLGDSVRFERKTPFGTTHWVRKKSELTADEQATLARTKDHGDAPAVSQRSPVQPAEKR